MTGWNRSTPGSTWREGSDAATSRTATGRIAVEPATRSAHARFLAGLAADIAVLRAQGTQVVVASSGAVALGSGLLLNTARPKTMDEKQACAAAGQSALMHAWESAVARHGITVAQILLTLYDTEDRRRWLNARATIERLLALGACPIVNENDTVTTDEIRYGDNAAHPTPPRRRAASTRNR